MTQEQNTKSNAAPGSNGGSNASITFMLDKNLGLTVDEKPWSDVLPAAGITAEASTDLAYIDQALADRKPDIAYIPCADFHRLVRKGDHHYRGKRDRDVEIHGRSHVAQSARGAKGRPGERARRPVAGQVRVH